MTDSTFTSYAQNMEDIRLWRALRHVTPGRYIDVGAWDPRVDSVSRGFYERGWRGVHFEPHPRLAARLRADRPDEPVHEVALSDHEGTLRLFLHGDDGTATADPEVARTAARPGRSSTAVVVRATTLACACADLAGHDVHWMKIDVEGLEAAVLRGWDATALRPWVVVVEATKPHSRTPTHEAFAPLLSAADYLPAGFDGLNRYYVAREHGDLVAAVEEPVSVFDLMEGCRLCPTSPFVAPHLERLRAIEGSLVWRVSWPVRRLAARLGFGARG
ncbi:MAG: FkbM family methyltransferase [Planctomycetaceae bacterium]